jgi:hypothetical protein
MAKPIPAALLLLTALSCTSAPHGPVALSPDRHSFVDAGAEPCFWLGDTQWELFLSFKEDEARTLLEDRRRKGFNAIQVMLLGVGGGKKPNADGARPFLNDTISTPNEAYFSRVDAVVRSAEQLGLVLVIGIYHKSPDAGRMITKDNARDWGAWVGRRYRDFPNIIWSMFPVASAAYVPVVRELAAGLAAGDGGRHLITVHPDPSPASSSWIHDEAWLSFNTLQSFKSSFLNYTMVAADRARTPVKPVVNGEARYEDEAGTTALNVRRGAYWSCLAGGFYSYGHGGNWMKPADWRKWIDSPGSRQMRILGDFFRSLDWWTLEPDPSLLSGKSGEAAAARSANRSWALVYLPANASVEVVLDGVNAAPSAQASWMNPATGEVQQAGVHPASGSRTFAPPAEWADALLLIRSR